jgi:diphosphomevalonate decarboxylase
MTLGGLSTECEVLLTDGEDEVTVNRKLQQRERYRAIFSTIRLELRTSYGFLVKAKNDFPTSAGLASSSSGFAAIAAVCGAASGLEKIFPKEERCDDLFCWISRISRIGSASASRSVYGGFTALPAGGEVAEVIAPQDFWKDIRVLVCITDTATKPVSSRDGMILTAETSPYYRPWVEKSGALFTEAKSSLLAKDLQKLVELVRLSYSRMHSVMLAASPPLLYWRPETVGLIRLCLDLRKRGIQAWETIDAGPQVKILCLEGDIERIENEASAAYPTLSFIRAYPGRGVVWKKDSSP